MPTIRTASESDGPSILKLTEATRIFAPMELSCVEELWNAYRDRGEASGYTFLVYQDDDATLGYACFGPHPLTDATYDLYWIAVDPAAQGRGIGHALLAWVEVAVRAVGGRLLLIETSDTPNYASARRLYETSGYRREAIVHDFYAPGDDLLIFAKEMGADQPQPTAWETYKGVFSTPPTGVLDPKSNAGDNQQERKLAHLSEEYGFLQGQGI